MRTFIKNLNSKRINQKEYIIFTLLLLAWYSYSILKNVQNKDYAIACVVYIFWSILNSILLRSRANDMDDFKNTNLDEMKFSFFFGSFMPVLNLGIIFYYATSKSK